MLLAASEYPHDWSAPYVSAYVSALTELQIPPKMAAPVFPLRRGHRATRQR
jgi:hypothetical protein